MSLPRDFANSETTIDCNGTSEDACAIRGTSTVMAYVVLVIVFVSLFEYLITKHFFALRNRTLSRRAHIVMEAAPGCMLIYVIAPYFVSNKPHELIAIALTVLAASRFSMLVTVLIGVGSSGL